MVNFSAHIYKIYIFNSKISLYIYIRNLKREDEAEVVSEQFQKKWEAEMKKEK